MGKQSHNIDPAIRHRKAFTLVEIVVVLLVLAILATIALEAVEPQVDQAKFEGTQRTIQNYEDAIFSENRNSDGTITAAGFFVDMGRVPFGFIEQDEFGRDILTARELWTLPPGVLSFSSRSVIDNNVVIANADNDEDGNTDGERDDLDGDPIVADREVIVASGWRGPYLRLPIGATGLTDSWGNPLVTYLNNSDPNLTSPYSHLRTSGDLAVTLTQREIYSIRSLGRDDNRDDVVVPESYDRDLPSLMEPQRLSSSILFSTITGSVSLEKSIDGDAENATAALLTDVVVQLYYPDSATGKVRIERATIENERHDTANERDLVDFRFLMPDPLTPTDPPVAVQFPIGLRAMRAYYNDQDDTGDFSDDNGTDPNHKSRVEYKSLKTGPNSITLTLD